MPQAAEGLACQHGSSGLTWKSRVLGSDLALRMEWDGLHAKLTGALPRWAHREVQGFPLAWPLGKLQGGRSTCGESRVGTDLRLVEMSPFLASR